MSLHSILLYSICSRKVPVVFAPQHVFNCIPVRVRMPLSITYRDHRSTDAENGGRGQEMRRERKGRCWRGRGRGGEGGEGGRGSAFGRTGKWQAWREKWGLDGAFPLSLSSSMFISLSLGDAAAYQKQPILKQDAVVRSVDTLGHRRTKQIPSVLRPLAHYCLRHLGRKRGGHRCRS